MKIYEKLEEALRLVVSMIIFLILMTAGVSLIWFVYASLRMLVEMCVS